MYKVTNISNTVIGLVRYDGLMVVRQYNIFPNEYITVEKVSEQMLALADPARRQILIERMV